MNKVEELVEWVANEIWATIHPSRTCTLRQAGKDTMSAYYKVAKQILSHPDLALIDRENDLPEVAYHSSNWCLIPRRFIKSHIEVVIPPAGALEQS